MPRLPRPPSHQSLTKTLLATPGIRVFLLWATLFLCCVQYGRRNFYRDPGSIFFDQSRAYERWYSLWREHQAEEFIQRAGKVGVEAHGKAGADPRVCASFITVRRDVEKQYIEVSLGSLLQGLSPAERADLHLKVLFADADPSQHAAWNQTWLRTLVDEVYSYADAVAPDTLERLRNLSMQRSLVEKGAADYALALRRCHTTTQAPYIAVFEDDVLVAEGWFVRTLLGLRDVEGKMAARGRTGQWSSLRLFNEERSTGWASQATGGNNEHWIALAIGAALCTVLVSTRRRSRVVRAHLDNWALAVICCLAVPSFVVLFFKAGKASLLPPLPGVREEAFGCCSQGLVFAREIVPGLIDYLENNGPIRSEESNFQLQQEVGKYDMMTRDYSKSNGLASWALYPVQLQHIGTSSAMQTGHTEAQIVWSTAFENLNPKSLVRAHARMLEQIYGPNVSAAGSQHPN